jgi:hypothetical protein
MSGHRPVGVPGEQAGQPMPDRRLDPGGGAVRQRRAHGLVAAERDDGVHGDRPLEQPDDRDQMPVGVGQAATVELEDPGDSSIGTAGRHQVGV